MARKKKVENEGVSKITIYKLKKDFPVDDALCEYDEAKSTSLSGWSFRIFVRLKPNVIPAWQPLVKDWIDDNDIPRNAYSSLVILFEKDEHLFALTAGYGYASVREYGIGDFGVNIALKSLDPNQLNHLYQKVPTGNVYGLSRWLRGRYMPTNDQINRRSVLKAIRGKVINQDLGISMEGRTSLAISGKKDLSDVVTLLDQILDIERSEELTVHIRGLDEVPKDMKKKLEEELLDTINSGEFDNVLFGYDDDLVFDHCETLKVGRDNTAYSIDDTQKVLDAAKRQKPDNPAKARIIGYDEQGMTVFEKSLIDLIEGELDYEGNKYFRIDKKWYKTNAEYKKKIEEDFTDIGKIESDYFGTWRQENGKFVDESKFLSENVGGDKIIAHTKKISRIEFADIIDLSESYIIHVKRGKGAYLRNLFAQGYVSASLYNGDTVFRKAVADKFGVDTSRGFTVVYAIFPDGETDVDSVFTLFAKVDFLERYEALKAMGFAVKYCLIG